MSNLIQFHPLANLFPLLDGDEFASLTDDIRTNGLREQIMLFEGAILDGRNRYRACISAGIDPRFEIYSGDDPLATQYVEMARDVLGNIDLDPASHAVAQETVRAARFFTQEDDGLKQKWAGRVWLNPPYSQPEIAHFVDKLTSEYFSGDVREGILLTNNCTDAKWFHTAIGAARRVCFTRGRIRFSSPTGDCGAPVQGQSFFYFGDNVERFESIFSAIGSVVEPSRVEGFQ